MWKYKLIRYNKTNDNGLDLWWLKALMDARASHFLMTCFLNLINHSYKIKILNWSANQESDSILFTLINLHAESACLRHCDRAWWRNMRPITHWVLIILLIYIYIYLFRVTSSRFAFSVCIRSINVELINVAATKIMSSVRAATSIMCTLLKHVHQLY